MRGMVHDLAYAVRLFRRAPGFTGIVTLTLALGIGANTAVFSILNAVLLQPLPYRNPSRLVAIWDREIHAKGVSKLFDLYSDYENWKRDSRSFEEVAAVTWATQTERILTGRGPARSVMALPVTAEFFSLVGVAPMLGRTFAPADANRGCSVVLAESFWQSAFGGQQGAKPRVVGETIRLDDQACTVLGVMPPGFAFLPPEAPVTMWTILPQPAHPDQLAVGVFGRLRPGVSIAAAQAEVTARHRELHAHDRWGAQVEPVVYGLHDEFTWLTGRNLRLSLIVLFAAVSFVLLICCVNVANLLLGRAVGRQREMALRAALGSGRGRLLRQLLTESLLLSAGASLAGAALAGAAVHYFRVARPIEMPPGMALELNARVLAFTAFLSVLTAVVFGIVPAWKASRTDLNEALKAGGKASSQDRGHHRLGQALIVAEVMLTVVLLSGAGLLIQTLQRFASAPLGFQPDGLITASLHLPKTGYGDAPHRAQFYDRLETALAAIPGIQSAALSSARPFLGGGSMDVVEVEGHPEPRIDNLFDTFLQTVSKDYFRVMGVPLEQGRYFEPGDREQTQPVAIINEALVRKYFPNENPIGRQVRPFNGGKRGDSWLRVVGVVGNEKRTTVYQEMAWVDAPVLYRPVGQNPNSANLIARVRAGGGSARGSGTTRGSTLGGAIQRAAAAIDPEVPVDEIQPVRNLEARRCRIRASGPRCWAGSRRWRCSSRSLGSSAFSRTSSRGALTKSECVWRWARRAGRS
ncbi:MAG: ABC transporter permease [Bryobacteraceae bacterium]